MHCVFTVPNPTRFEYGETPKSLAMFVYYIREWLQTYHCLFMHSNHYEMHFHARQHPICCRIAEIPPPTTATAIITDIVDIGVSFKCISASLRCVVSFEVRLCSATVAIATERMSTVAHTIWIHSFICRHVKSSGRFWNYTYARNTFSWCLLTCERFVVSLLVVFYCFVAVVAVLRLMCVSMSAFSLHFAHTLSACIVKVVTFSVSESRNVCAYECDDDNVFRFKNHTLDARQEECNHFCRPTCARTQNYLNFYSRFSRNFRTVVRGVPYYYLFWHKCAMREYFLQFACIV